MYRPRLIPVLLLQDSVVVNSVQFKKYRDIGNPLQIVKQFNDLQADELCFLDITATNEKRSISVDLVKKINETAKMPFTIGGGIKNIKQINEIIEAGADKVILNSVTYKNAKFITEAAKEFGSSKIVVCIDVKKNFWGKESVWFNQATKSHKITPGNFARSMQDLGAGQIILQSIERDGTMLGYDGDLIKDVLQQISIPLTVVGGANEFKQMVSLSKNSNIYGFGVGSKFLFNESTRKAEITYPSTEEISNLFEK